MISEENTIMATRKTEGAAPRNIYSSIKLWLPSLSKIEKRIAMYLYDHPKEIASMPMAKVAEACSCSEGSVDRLCKKLGCSGYAQAREMLAAHPLPSEDSVSQVNIKQNTPVEELIQNINDLYINTLQRTKELNPAAKFETAIGRIARAKRLFFFGIGDALVPCLSAYYRFRRTGIDCLFDQDADMQLINASMIEKDDVVIAVSHSGNTRQVNAAMKAAHEAGAFCIGITQSVKSPMTQYCDLLFFNAVSESTVGNTNVAHRLAESTIMEILYAGVVTLIPEQAQKYLVKSAENLQVNKET